MSHDEKKLVTIIVNTQEHQVEKEKISFDELVHLAFNPLPTGNDIQFQIAYHKGQGNKEGKLLPGQSVEVKNGMIFDVTTSYKS